MSAVMKHTGLKTFDAAVPNEIGGLNAFEALLAAHRFGKSALDTDLVARAYPMIYHTIRCLNNVPVAPAAISNGTGKSEVCDNKTLEMEQQLKLSDIHNPRQLPSRRRNAKCFNQTRITWWDM